mgnify:CR=1 FL=1
MCILARSDSTWRFKYRKHHPLDALNVELPIAFTIINADSDAISDYN